MLARGDVDFVDVVDEVDMVEGANVALGGSRVSRYPVVRHARPVHKVHSAHNLRALRLLALVLPAALGFPLAGAARPADDAPAVSAFVSILPQEYFVERVGGDRVSVETLVEPGRSPATFEPTPKQMARLAEADVFFRIGVPFEEGLMPKIEGVMKGLEIVDLREGIEPRRMESHGGHAEHEEFGGGLDPHIWLSPNLVKTQAATICEALVALDPDGASTYRANLESFQKDLTSLHGRVAKALAPARGKTLMVFHPSWGYFADEFGLKQWAIEAEGKSPTARQLARIIDEAKQKGVKFIVVQRQFSATTARAVAEAIGAEVLSLDPLAKDYIANMESLASAVEKALGE